MFCIGIDLAWGTRRPTGVAVVDAEGRLLEVASVQSDEEILGLVEPYASGACTVGFDAPLVVTNPTGNRPAERALNADFARFAAGAHPSNTGKPEFADGTRAGRLAQRLGLDLDHTVTPRGRHALEVYPHAATVSLFRLPRTLRYKQKQGRDLELLRRELLALVGLLEGLDHEEPALHLTGAAWTSLRRRVEEATRKSELRHVEDQVDAVVCAYVALFATRRPGDVTAYGDPETGVIVTPTLPPDLEPAPRAAASGSRRSGDAGDLGAPAVLDAVDAVAQYASLHPRLVALEPVLRERLTALLDDGGIDYLSVTSRTKTVASFAEKVRRLDADGEPLYPDPLRHITDKIGLRVITYVHADVAAVATLLHDHLRVLLDRDWGHQTASEGRFGYASRHLLLAADEATAPAELRAAGPRDPAAPEDSAGFIAQVQVRTMLQHAWAEFEHDIRYKGRVPAEHASDFDRRFTLAAGLLELADEEFATIRDTLRAGVGGVAGTQHTGIEPRELAAFLAGQYDDAGWSRADHYAWIAGLVEQVGIGSLAELAETLRQVDEGVVGLRMGYRHTPGAVRRLDDALLLVHGEDYVALRGNAHRRDLLHARLARLRGE